MCREPLVNYNTMTEVSLYMLQPLNHFWCQVRLLFSHFSGEVFTRLHQVALHYSEGGSDGEGGRGEGEREREREVTDKNGD